jgi:nicotinamidase-related amidase
MTTLTQTKPQLPIPPFFEPARVGEVRRVPYQQIATTARQWAKTHNVKAAAKDPVRIGLLPIDCQLTFCGREFELFVGGRSGNGAIDDTRRLCEFIYRNLNRITAIHPTLDTHTTMQIFFDIFFVDGAGQHPAPMTMISRSDLERQVWQVNPAIAHSLGVDFMLLQHHVLHYAAELEKRGKYLLTIWPYHAMLGSIGHALVPALEEACFFHTQARHSQVGLEIKGGNPLTENYSVLRPEVMNTSNGQPIAQKNVRFIEKLMKYDYVIIAGQAKSHCVAWTIDDLLSEITAQDPKLARKVYLLEDCTSPVVIPGVVDFTDEADAAFARFKAAGMHIVRSTDPIESWPDVTL